MQREIKFRAWDIESKCYTKDEFLISGCYKNEIQVLGISMDREAECMNDEVVLEQFSGLKDKAGKEIYEGDIVEGLGYKYEVSFHNGSFSLIDDDEHYLLSTSSYDSLEVIGNIHEHPELLNG